MQGKFGEQIMADLPKICVNDHSVIVAFGPFFGSFLVKKKEKIEMKRYVALFTCLVSKTVHIKLWLQ